MANTAFLKDWGLPDQILGRVGRYGGPQRILQFENHLLIIIHQLPRPDKVHRDASFFYLRPDGTWKSSTDDGLAGLESHLRAYQNQLEKIDQRLDRTRTAEGYFKLYRIVSPIERAAENQLRTLQEARSIVGEIPEYVTLRDLADDIRRTAELMCTEIQQAMDFKVAHRAEHQARLATQQAKAAHRLNLIVAFFFPLTAMASLFGVNLVTGFEGFTTPLFFWFLVVASLAVGLLLRSDIDPS